MQSWYTDINNYRRLFMYSKFKHDVYLETYIDNIYFLKDILTLKGLLIVVLYLYMKKVF